MKPTALRLRARITIRPTAPFLFDATFHKPDHFTSGDNLWQPGIRWQTWLQDGVPLGLKFENKGTTAKPRVRVAIYAAKNLRRDFIASLTEEIRYRYNLDLDLKPFYAQFKTDAILGPIIKKWRGMRPGHPSSLYEYLIIGIVLQNATVRRSIQMFQTLLSKYGTPVSFDGRQLWCFWRPGRLTRTTVDDLRKLKVGYRAKSIKKTDDAFRNGLMDETNLRAAGRDTQMQELLKLYGVGPATVWYLLFDVFHRWDFFNHVSPWEQKIYSKVFFNKNPEHPASVQKILKHFTRFGDYKQLAVHYIWEDLWWRHKQNPIDWLKKEIRT